MVLFNQTFHRCSFDSPHKSHSSETFEFYKFNKMKFCTVVNKKLKPHKYLGNEEIVERIQTDNFSVSKCPLLYKRLVVE